jgi:hypothetical protein
VFYQHCSSALVRYRWCAGRKSYHVGDAAQLGGVEENEREGVQTRASELVDSMLRLASSTLQEAISHIEEHSDVGVPRVSASTIQEFIERAFRQRASIAIHLSDLGCVTDALVKAVRAELPDLTPGDIVSKITASILLQCPNCGYFTQEAVAHLVLAAKGAYKPGVIADSVVATGPNVASLGQGECPKCKSIFSILSINLRDLGIIRKTWWQFWK